MTTFIRIESHNPSVGWKGILMGNSKMLEELHSPKTIKEKCKFFFTPLGWRKLGKELERDCKDYKIKYRIVREKSNNRSIIYKDKYQVVFASH